MIEGINRPPSDAEIKEMDYFMCIEHMGIVDIINFVNIYQSNAKFRSHHSKANVRVGNHRPIPSGFEVKEKLQFILTCMDLMKPYNMHNLYETLHPFTDCNGRSGRALWAWQYQKIVGAENMHRIWDRGFLHTWYYDSLSEGRG